MYTLLWDIWVVNWHSGSSPTFLLTWHVSSCPHLPLLFPSLGISKEIMRQSPANALCRELVLKSAEVSCG